MWHKDTMLKTLVVLTQWVDQTVVSSVITWVNSHLLGFVFFFDSTKYFPDYWLVNDPSSLSTSKFSMFKHWLLCAVTLLSCDLGIFTLSKNNWNHLTQHLAGLYGRYFNTFAWKTTLYPGNDIIITSPDEFAGHSLSSFHFCHPDFIAREWTYLLICLLGSWHWTSSWKWWTFPLFRAVQNCLLIFVSLVGMATCCFSSLQEPLPPQGTWWTPLAHTHLHRSRPLLPPPRPRSSRARCQRLRSRKTRSTSIWPSRMARSTGTKTLSCERRPATNHHI